MTLLSELSWAGVSPVDYGYGLAIGRIGLVGRKNGKDERLGKG